MPPGQRRGVDLVVAAGFGGLLFVALETLKPFAKRSILAPSMTPPMTVAA